MDIYNDQSWLNVVTSARGVRLHDAGDPVGHLEYQLPDYVLTSRSWTSSSPKTSPYRCAQAFLPNQLLHTPRAANDQRRSTARSSASGSANTDPLPPKDQLPTSKALSSPISPSSQNSPSRSAARSGATPCPVHKSSRSRETVTRTAVIAITTAP